MTILDRPWLILAGWLVLMSLVLLIVMGLDKNKARRGAWRVPEARLFFLALLGGGLGGWIGMRLFHHKTRHWTFALGFPLIALVQWGAVLWLWLR